MLTRIDCAVFRASEGLIQDMIEKLVADAQKEASHKAFCDEEMSVGRVLRRGASLFHSWWMFARRLFGSSVAVSVVMHV